MAFLIYKRTRTGQKIRYERWKPLRLGGDDGLIARHVRTLRGAETASWKLEAAALVKLAGFTSEKDDWVVLFDAGNADAASICLYQLARIHGTCQGTSTQLALDFSVVLDREIEGDPVEYAKNFEASLPEAPRVLGELLALTGGPGGGDWKWTASGMNLGATVVQPRLRSPLGQK
jgi:hypothetical protein